MTIVEVLEAGNTDNLLQVYLGMLQVPDMGSVPQECVDEVKTEMLRRGWKCGEVSRRWFHQTKTLFKGTVTLVILPEAVELELEQ